MTALAEVAASIRRRSGIVLAPPFASLAAAVGRLAPGGGIGEILHAERPSELLDALIDAVAVKETFFFRNEPELATIDWPALLRQAGLAGRSGLRVWSAACATGEEAYTLAILACEALGSCSPPVSVLGTDLSPSAVQVACRGVYGAGALRAVQPARRDRWFDPAGNGVRVDQELRKLVALRPHNLVRDPIPPAGEGPFDVIVCRNVLIYFDRPTVQRTLSALERALRPGGTLVIGAADRLAGPHSMPALHGPAQAEPATPRGRRAPARKPGPALGPLHEEDPLSADDYFLRGMAELAEGRPGSAVVSLRRALYLDPDFGLAAFKLARAYDALHDVRAASRTYLRALHSLTPDDPRDAVLMAQVDVADVAAACRRRIAALSTTPARQPSRWP